MRHHWENKSFELGNPKVVETCTRCGLVRIRTEQAVKGYIGGFRKCVTTDERLNKQNTLARIIDRHIRFYAPVLALVFLASCSPSRQANGKHWPPWDVWHCVTARPEWKCRVYPIQSPK